MTMIHRTSVSDLDAWRRAGAIATAEHVADLMSWPALAVDVDTSSGAALDLMVDREIHHLLIQASHNLVGVVCTCDLDLLPSSVEASRNMSRRVVRIDPEATLAEAEALMTDREVACLPSYWQGTWGVLTRGDLVRRGVCERVSCTCCGGHHHVRVGEDDRAPLPLCIDCLEVTQRDTVDRLYVDLGVSG